VLRPAERQKKHLRQKHARESKKRVELQKKQNDDKNIGDLKTRFYTSLSYTRRKYISLITAVNLKWQLLPECELRNMQHTGFHRGPPPEY
jgi:hypothetical protein